MILIYIIAATLVALLVRYLRRRYRMHRAQRELRMLREHEQRIVRTEALFEEHYPGGVVAFHKKMAEKDREAP